MTPTLPVPGQLQNFIDMNIMRAEARMSSTVKIPLPFSRHAYGCVAFLN